VSGGAGKDVIDASGVIGGDPEIPMQFFGNAGDDVIKAGGSGLEWLNGGQGVDTAVFAGNSANYTITREAATGYPGWINVYDNTTQANDWLISVENLQFADQTIAGSKRPAIVGTAAADALSGTALDEEIYGGSGNDVIDGGDGSDILFGGAGNDKLIAGSGYGALTGGEGSDRFVFQSGWGDASIADFKSSDGDIITSRALRASTASAS